MPLRRTFLSLTAALAGTAALSVTPAVANETDQYTMPTDKRFADIGPFISASHYYVLERVVDGLNEQIRDARLIVDDRLREEKLAYLHSPRTLADQVRYSFEPGFVDTITLESVLHSANGKKAFGDGITAYKTMGWIYTFVHLPFDPRNIPLLFQSSTVKAYGAYFGTDKLAHFHDLGHMYFVVWHGRVQNGWDPDEARARTVWEFSRGPISENALIGFFASGVFSNGDLASNYVGMKFYENLTEPVMLKGEKRPPLLVRVGDYWRLNCHVRPESDFFAWYVSDHWNEALNPSIYEWGMRHTIARRMRNMADDLVEFYCELDGRPADPAYFNALAEELGTYYGEDYGYSGRIGKSVLTLGTHVLPYATALNAPARTEDEADAIAAQSREADRD